MIKQILLQPPHSHIWMLTLSCPVVLPSWVSTPLSIHWIPTHVFWTLMLLVMSITVSLGETISISGKYGLKRQRAIVDKLGVEVSSVQTSSLYKVHSPDWTVTSHSNEAHSKPR